MKAIILAAGIGRRLYPITETVPKSMIQLNGKPIIQYKIDALKAAGIHDIVVVVGHLKEVLKASLPKDITIIYNDKFRTTNNMYSLWLAREHTKDGFMLLNADVIHDNEIIRRVVEAGYSLIAVDSSRSNIKELNVSCDQNLTINRVEFNLPQEVIYGESAQIMKLDKNDAQVFMRNVNMQMGLGKLDTPVSVIPQELLKHMDLKAFDISQYQWREIDDHFDLNIASMVARMLEKKHSLKGEVTLITGAAGGIGSEICNILADLGSDIIMADRNQDKLIILKEKLRRKHVKVHIINIDISSELSISQCIDQIFKKVGFLNMVVHGAGFFSPFNLDDIPAKDQSELFIANIFGPYMLSEKILEHWTHKPGKKKMLYISSIAGLENNPQKRQAYAFSKRMNIEIFHRNITKFANQKIDFVCACPGPTNTKMWKKVCKTIAEYEDITPEEVLDKYQRSSSNRVWEPRDTAYAIVDCLIGGKNGELFNIDNHSIIKYNPDYNTKELMSIINSMRFIP